MDFLKDRKDDQGGFSLVELIIVLFLIVILIVVIINVRSCGKQDESVARALTSYCQYQDLI